MLIKKAAQKVLNKLPLKISDAFYAAFDKIEAGDVEGLDIKKLAGREGYRLRIGKYRAIFGADMIVTEIGSRSDVYK